MHIIHDRRGVAITEITLDGVHVAESAGQQFQRIRILHQLVQIALQRRQMVLHLDHHLWQQIKIHTLGIHRQVIPFIAAVLVNASA